MHDTFRVYVPIRAWLSDLGRLEGGRGIRCCHCNVFPSPCELQETHAQKAQLVFRTTVTPCVVFQANVMVGAAVL